MVIGDAAVRFVRFGAKALRGLRTKQFNGLRDLDLALRKRLLCGKKPYAALSMRQWLARNCRTPDWCAGSTNYRQRTRRVWFGPAHHPSS